MKHAFNGNRPKDRRILELYYKDYTYDQIASEVRSSPNYISSVIKRERNRVEKEKGEKRNARALQLFVQGRSPLDVCIKLEISTEEAFRLHNDYLELTNRSKLVEIHKKLRGNLPDLIDLFETMKDSGMPTKKIVKISRDHLEIPYVEDRLEKCQHALEELEYKLDRCVSDWIELNDLNINLKKQNKNLINDNGYLEDRNSDLKNTNRNLQVENLRLRSMKADLERSLARANEDLINRALPTPRDTTSPESDSRYFCLQDPLANQQRPYFSLDPCMYPRIQEKLNNSCSIKEINYSSVSFSQNMDRDETKSNDIKKDLTSSKPSQSLASSKSAGAEELPEGK